MTFNEDVHSRTGCVLLRASEDMLDLLEENQVQLQNMMTSKEIIKFQYKVQTKNYCPTLLIFLCLDN